jgi:hypothetical protein
MTAKIASSHNVVASVLAQSAKEPQAKAAKETQPQATKGLQATKESQGPKGTQDTKGLQPNATKALPARATKEPQAKAAEFIKLDAATLPIIKKIPIGGDADWLAIGFGSVWVTVAKNNEIVRVDPARNVVQARVKVDKEPCNGIGIGVDRVWVLNCQS